MHAGTTTSSLSSQKEWENVENDVTNPYITPGASDNEKKLAHIVKSDWENKKTAKQPCLQALSLIVRYANADPSVCNQKFPDKLKAIYKQQSIATQSEADFIKDSKALIKELRQNQTLRIAMDIQDAIMSATSIDTKIILIEQFADQFAESQAKK